MTVLPELWPQLQRDTLINRFVLFMIRYSYEEYEQITIAESTGLYFLMNIDCFTPC